MLLMTNNSSMLVLLIKKSDTRFSKQFFFAMQFITFAYLVYSYDKWKQTFLNQLMILFSEVHKQKRKLVMTMMPSKRRLCQTKKK